MKFYVIICTLGQSDLTLSCPTPVHFIGSRAHHTEGNTECLHNGKKQTSREVERDRVMDMETVDRERQRRSQVISGSGRVPASALTNFFPSVNLYPQSLGAPRSIVSPNSVAFSWVQLSMFIESSQLLHPGFFSKRHIHTSSSITGPSYPHLPPVESDFCSAASVRQDPDLLCTILSHLPTSWLSFGLYLALTESHTCWFLFCIISFVLLWDF